MRTRHKLTGVRRSVIVGLCAALSALAATSSAFAWSNYFGPGTLSASDNTRNSGYNYWTNNRVWKPASSGFGLYYHNSSGDVGFKTNSTDNPFTHNGGGFGYSQAYCFYLDSGSVNPVTCQATT